MDLLDYPNFSRLRTIDITSDETRTVYAVEAQYRDELPFADVYSQEALRDSAAKTLLEKNYKVCIYDMVCHFNTDIDEATDFARDNLRLNS